MVQKLSTHLQKVLPALANEAGHGHGQGLGHGHSHGFSDGDEESGVRRVVVSQVLELGIVSHSIIIGISLGVSHSPCTIRPLIAALSFHQFFEGFVLGGCIWQAQFKTQSATLMACFFCLNNSSRDQHWYCSCFSLQPKQPRCSDC